ncbi:MAG: Fic family protein [Pseudomonadota bacterium]
MKSSVAAESGDGPIRHSRAETPTIITDSQEKARLESANSLRLTDRVKEMVLDALHGERPFRLRPSTLLDLNRCAIEGLDSYAGNWRPAGIGIEKSKHQPPGGHLVPELVEELCDYVNDNWAQSSAINLSAVVMWRVNWIHPFTDGNGRTARAASELVLNVRSGFFLPGVKAIPERILLRRVDYYGCLEDADRRFGELGTLSDEVVCDLASLLESMLALQLQDIHEKAAET